MSGTCLLAYNPKNIGSVVANDNNLQSTFPGSRKLIVFDQNDDFVLIFAGNKFDLSKITSQVKNVVHF